MPATLTTPPTLATLDAAFTACDSRTGSHNQVRLSDLRRELALPREQADALIHASRRLHGYFLEQAESRVTRDDLDAAIREHGDTLIYIGRRD